MSYHVPEQHRWASAGSGYHTKAGESFGVFLIPGRAACGRSLMVIADDGEHTGWEHVSVSVQDQPTRTPSWAEMCAVKDLFWGPEDCVVQYHPPKTDTITRAASTSGSRPGWSCRARRRI